MRTDKVKRFFLLFFAAAAVCAAAYSLYAKPNATENKSVSQTGTKIIAEKSYVTFAWGFQYTGEVICSDGNIYGFDHSYAAPDCPETLTSLENASEYVLSDAQISGKRVSNADMARINELIASLEDKNESRHNGYDAGANSVIVYDYARGEKITLASEGGWIIENSTKNSKELQKIINRYLN